MDQTNQAKGRIINLSVNVPCQSTFYLQNWDSANSPQTAIVILIIALGSLSSFKIVEETYHG